MMMVGARLLMPWIICDLDGTLSDSSHRNIYAQMKQWGQFHSMMSMDKPDRVVAGMLRMYQPTTRIGLVTGRPMEYVGPTITWLIAHDIPFDELHMRDMGDVRGDAEYKQEVYTKHFKKRDVAFVLDDRDKVVDMWREQGLLCLQPRKGAY